MFAEKHRQRERGDEIAELQDRLAWYQENGWTSAAVEVQADPEAIKRTVRATTTKSDRPSLGSLIWLLFGRVR